VKGRAKWFEDPYKPVIDPLLEVSGGLLFPSGLDLVEGLRHSLVIFERVEEEEEEKCAFA